MIGVTPPRMSADGDTALLTVQNDVPDNDVYGDAGPLEKAVEPTQEAGIQVVRGELPDRRKCHGRERGKSSASSRR